MPTMYDTPATPATYLTCLTENCEHKGKRFISPGFLGFCSSCGRMLAEWL